MMASEEGRTDIVQVLLEAGADPNRPGQVGGLCFLV
jgi:ankyrin repeat protein